MAGMALAGAGISIIGQFAKAEEEKRQARLAKQEAEWQAKTSQDLFDLTFPNYVQQQRAEMGALATGYAKGGVAVESVSVLANLSEQARVHSLDQALKMFEKDAQVRGFRIEADEAKRSIGTINRNLILGIAGSVVGGATDAAEYGGFTGRSSRSSSKSSSSSVLQPRNSSSVYGPPTADGRNPG